MIILLILLICSAAAQDECQPTSCNATGPMIRFPFRLIGRQPEHCGYPGFDLSCNSNNITVFDFQFPVRASTQNIILPISARATIEEIDYRNQVIRVSVLNGSCLPTRIPDVSSPASPFEMYYGSRPPSDGYTLFNCSSRPPDYSPSTVTCLRRGGFQVFAYGSFHSVTTLVLPGCTKIYNISDVPVAFFDGEVFFESQYIVDGTRLRWPEPSCGRCESRGRYCRLRNNQTECLVTPQEQQQMNTGVSRNVVIALVVVGVFLTDYKALRPTRYTYAEVKRITNGFKHKLGQGGYGTVFKGKLSNDILVAIKVLNNLKGNGEEFINEVGTIGKIHHVNVVRLVGYCADGYKRALVYEFLENDSLEKYISSGNQSRTLGWEKVHNIALGIAKGIDYLHQGCNQRILHFDIKPQNILLDHNLNPKVADFGLAKLRPKEQSIVTMTAARGTIGYIAPEVFSRNFGNVSYRSDIYSFGMLLLDMVGGRKNFYGAGEESSEVYFPEWMYNQLDKGQDIAIQIEKAEESDIVKRLIIVGLWCIQWYPVDRPSTKVVIRMLEHENMPVMPPNPFAASESVNTNVKKDASSSGTLLSNAETSLSSD
ncbi:hypothetical protein BUALT_Bualt01G0079600 [Buddleja alternifolia]|uniref:Protein kinase domain-containing protein n=1 Tax=Buddleja alternifolia TaxID=168488 RepID=A0AAV6YBC3_9LAMI|nr:hypothetical protein BUALT_Bualt01G0079600 [Buddleja alternifolia]